ncbi:ribosome recycling factor [Clostridium thermosuccinogenes]|jgi:ribosome recycling factor|uniref:Ribosome-recycling factor n=1 Tax=Clostridium thermosuccinogenes TaxID=84032 RepID=A0A2K2FQN8_9CLOT|nr:ribosome recycling factor [Pseudoclostridium thermosuccinogenes]AUS96014.1 ribosome recycling factor [Pseudoclostridium thermosuccinogenes]PNT93262.1 ribosome recycling factor [Pseudoclostridium thermosuccinogenes]PNT99403.1 ribosome recycling factor [Pseudoclostridium thermosuccinogenes]PNU01090.1 ribosome recycling factor [Pseudoclostridium thermosuccinogenes]
MVKDDYKPFEEKMKKTISVLKEELAGLRAGRANPAILDKVTIDYYGTPTPINQLGNISVPEARVILIQPWDAKILKEIEKAIQKSDIGINPNNDGKVIRLVFPPLTEERRKELTKVAKKHGEDAKVAIRSIRRDAIEHFKALKKKSEISEDDLKVAEKDMQNITDKYISEIDKIVEIKEKEILEV